MVPICQLPANSVMLESKQLLGKLDIYIFALDGSALAIKILVEVVRAHILPHK